MRKTLPDLEYRKFDDDTSAIKMVLVDSTDDTRQLRLEPNMAIPVNIQDQVTDIVDTYFYQELGTFNLAADTIVDSNTFTAVAGHNIVVGDLLNFEQGSNFSQFIVTAVNTNVITVDSLFDKAYTSDDSYQRCTRNLNVNGSVTPQIFKYSPPTSESFDVTRIVIVIEDNSAMDFTTFGSLTKLSNGCFIRTKDGTRKNLFNWKSNGELINRGFDHSFQEKSGGGAFGFTCLVTFSGQENRGVSIRLTGADNDELQIVVQDDLSSLTGFRAIVQGHVIYGSG